MDIEHNNEQFIQDEFQIVSSNTSGNKQQDWFDHVVGLLQQIVICEQFQLKIQQFMRQNWNNNNQSQYENIFKKYHQTFTQYLSQKLSQKIQNFNLSYFFQLLNNNRRNQIDEQILDTLDSLVNINLFMQFIKDYKTSYEQIQTYKVLTIKSNKIPQNKTVKGKDNIFGATNSNPLFDMKMKKTKPKKQQSKVLTDKTQDQLMVPDLVLTVKGIRKG